MTNTVVLQQLLKDRQPHPTPPRQKQGSYRRPEPDP